MLPHLGHRLRRQHTQRHAYGFHMSEPGWNEVEGLAVEHVGGVDGMHGRAQVIGEGGDAGRQAEDMVKGGWCCVVTPPIRSLASPIRVVNHDSTNESLTIITPEIG